MCEPSKQPRFVGALQYPTDAMLLHIYHYPSNMGLRIYVLATEDRNIHHYNTSLLLKAILVSVEDTGPFQCYFVQLESYLSLKATG